ncbi:hypothetical protein CYMTET_53204, partial [Cymbomonas tetramitiformis]
MKIKKTSRADWRNTKRILNTTYVSKRQSKLIGLSSGDCSANGSSAAPLRYIVIAVSLTALYFILSPVYYFLQGVLTPMQYEEVRRPSATMPIPLTKLRKTLLDKADNPPSYNITYDKQYMFDAFVTDGGTRIAFLSPALKNVVGSGRPTKGAWECNWGRGFVTEGHSKDDPSEQDKSQLLQVWCDIPTAAQRVLKSSNYLNVILKRSAGGEVARYAITMTAPRLDPKPTALAFCTHLSLQKLTAQIDPSMIRAMLTEWIEYHSMLGVGHFYVYVDARPELDDASGAFKLLQQYGQDGLVTLVDWTVRYMLPSRSSSDVGRHWSEVLMANDCKLRFGEDAEWMAIGTPKDYLVPSLRHERVDQFLAEVGPGSKACAFGLATLAHFLPPSVDNAHVLVKSEEGTQANLILSRFPWVSKNFVPFAKGDGPVIVRPRHVAFIQRQGAACLDSVQQVVLLEPNCVPGSASTALRHCGLHAEDFRAITGAAARGGVPRRGSSRRRPQARRLEAASPGA